MVVIMHKILHETKPKCRLCGDKKKSESFLATAKEEIIHPLLLTTAKPPTKCE